MSDVTPQADLELTPHPELPEVDVAGNRVQLFVESPEYVAALVADMRAARKRIWIESYIVADDHVGHVLAEELKERARAGIACRLMYDAVGSLATPGSFMTELQAAGVEVFAYRTMSSMLFRYRFFQRFNRRNHRKLVVIDDEISYFGGMNFADPGSSVRPSKRQQSEAADVVDEATVPDAPARSDDAKYWRDLHVRMVGPRTAEIAELVDTLWNRVHDRPHRSRKPPSLSKFLASKEDGFYFFDAHPRLRYHRAARLFRRVIDRASRRVTLAMAYFIPTGTVLRSMLRARKKGVPVRAVVPGVSDVPAVQWAGRHMYDSLLRHGIDVYERQERMLHSKVMVVDDLYTVCGSCNIDPRSLLTNLEFIAIIRSRAVAEQVEAVWLFERSHSVPVRLGDGEKLPWWRRKLNAIAWFFRRWL